MLNNPNVWIIIPIITVFLDSYFFNKVLIHTGGLKISKIKANIVMGAMILLGQILYFTKVDPNIRVTIYILLGSLYYSYISKKNVFKGLIISLIYWMLYMGLDTISMSFVTYINSLESMSTIMEFNIYRFEVIVLSNILHMLAVNVYCNWDIKINVSQKDIAYIFIPIIANIGSFFIIYEFLVKERNLNLMNNKEVLLISILLLLSNLSLIFSIKKVLEDNKLIAESKLIKEKMQIQYAHYMAIQEDNMRIKKLHHDIKNHIICIKGIVSNNKNIDVNNYINNIENELDKYETSFNTKNMILDVILNEKSKVCKYNNIKLSVDINNFDKCNFIDTMDICSIFSNVLDNAIEACLKVKNLEKVIIIRGTIVNGFFVVRIENTKENEVSIKNNIIKTDKKNTYLHGIGIKSIKDSVSKYEGEVAIDYSENKFIMKIIIPLVP
ncbi:MAG: ATP-binding protein [Peptostreptococcaceae bacterium]